MWSGQILAMGCYQNDTAFSNLPEACHLENWQEIVYVQIRFPILGPHRMLHTQQPSCLSQFQII